MHDLLVDLHPHQGGVQLCHVAPVDLRLSEVWFAVLHVVRLVNHLFVVPAVRVAGQSFTDSQCHYEACGRFPGQCVVCGLQEHGAGGLLGHCPVDQVSDAEAMVPHVCPV